MAERGGLFPTGLSLHRLSSYTSQAILHRALGPVQVFNYSPSFARAIKNLRTAWYTNMFVHRISEMRTLFKYLASSMTFLLKFMHLDKHKHFPCPLVSKFLISNPNNVNLESEVKYLSCLLTHNSKVFVWQHSPKVGSDGSTQAGGCLF